MHLMYYLDASGKRVYTLKVCLCVSACRCLGQPSRDGAMVRVDVQIVESRIAFEIFCSFSVVFRSFNAVHLSSCYYHC